MELLKFWQDCRERRIAQLDALSASMDMLRVYNAPILLVREQQSWVDEARRKLKHAESMVAFFQEKLR